MTRNVIERAFELAREQDCQTIDDIRQRLKAERYNRVDSHLSGLTIKRQLSEVMKPER